MRAHLAVAAVAITLLSPSASHAQNCATNPRASLTGPSAPCPPKSRAPAKKEKEPEKKAQPPGTYQYGNTTITIGGSVSGGASTRLK
jgi:hypothetical protein